MGSRLYLFKTPQSRKEIVMVAVMLRVSYFIISVLGLFLIQVSIKIMKSCCVTSVGSPKLCVPYKGYSLIYSLIETQKFLIVRFVNLQNTLVLSIQVCPTIHQNHLH